MSLAIRRYAGRRQAHACLCARSSIPVRCFSNDAKQKRTTISLPALDEAYKEKELRRQHVRTNVSQVLKDAASRRKHTEGVPKGKKYILPMFPYPSGDLHLGHLRVYTISDVLARFQRMQGYDVMHPIGWDAFGLPAENAAIERGIDPAIWTKKNIQKMKSQLEAMNGCWDWDKEFATCDPTFYKHTQQLFLLLHEMGLAYQAESMVNYDPVDKTVLANEQVDASGHSWRSGAKVEKKMLKQWFFKITEFRQELLDGLNMLEEGGAWPERVLAMQKNWLGKSTGAKVKFPIISYKQDSHSVIEVFTTRPDTLFGVQYIALASTHPLVQSLAKSDVELQAFLDTLPALPLDSKVGYVLPHVRAVNPLAYEDTTPDATKASLPIYVAPYVLGDYGDGAVMGVPGHDSRDHAFWKENRYDDPVRMVIAQSADESTTIVNTQPYVHHGHLTEHSGPYAGKSTAEATKMIVDLLQTKDLGSSAETWRLRDWLVSRQRYWGTPIPIIHCGSCGPVPVPLAELPVELPPVQDHWGNGKTGNPLDHAHDWVNTKCPECGEAAKRDTDTMDTFVDSSWYFMRFPDAHNQEDLFSPTAADTNLPVDIYIGGVEHAILHLLYARFISKVLSKNSNWPAGHEHNGEPFKKLLAQGMVHGKTYSDPSSGRFLKPNEVDRSNPAQPMVASTGEVANVSFEKMSKSKYNGVNPGICMSKYGADATRAHILFQAPVSDILNWDEEKIAGITRWLKKLLGFVRINGRAWQQHEKISPFDPKTYILNSLTKDNRKDKSHESEKRIWRTVQQTIMSVTESYGTTHALNTVVSDLMALTNTLLHTELGEGKDTHPRINPQLLHHSIMTLLKLMAPITPAVADSAWEYVTPISDRSSTPPESFIPDSIFDHPFPTPDGTFELLRPDTQNCAIQINGKFIQALEIPIPPEHLKGETLEMWLREQILDSDEGKERLIGVGVGVGTQGRKKKVDIRDANKVIVVRDGRVVNFIV